MSTTIGTSSKISVSAGDQAPRWVHGPVTRTDLVRYAGAGGDFNPMHHDEQFAREAGLDTVFAMGMFHAGLLSRSVSGWLGLANVRKFAIRFTGQVWPDDTLTFDGVIDKVYEEDGLRVADCSFSVTRQTGDVAIRATATAVVA
jgi:acyl dehydratase